jgi:hypothetical protein
MAAKCGMMNDELKGERAFSSSFIIYLQRGLMKPLLRAV